VWFNVNYDQTELEVKFYLADLPALEARLRALGARLVQASLHEVNLRFDTPDRDLTRSYQVLRLRQDTAARMTYKGPGKDKDGVRLRQEIEFSVSNFEAARDLLLALGYQVSVMYEKYRTTYALDEVEVTLDQMPYGNFAEIEGPDPASIHRASERLGLNWERRGLESYTALFERLRTALGFTFRDLVFDNFRGLKITPADLGLQPADRP
jgi:adenylate cyclase class 2